MRKLFYCVVVLMMVLAIASCQENKQANIVFERVKGMMDDHPDSALAILDSMRKESESYPRSQKMRYELLCAKAQNKAYVDFTTDSVMKEVVEYYDDYGTPNEKVEAHYLLGCVYRDLHESPAALNCYYDAVECADTLSDDCDYGMLMRVYGQMAEEFDRQFMPYKELEANKKYQEYALYIKDTLNYILGFGLEKNAYVLLKDTNMVVKSLTIASKLLSKYGYHAEAAQMQSSMIHISISRKEFEKAKSYLQQFEKESNLFDSCGNIAKGHEYYYYTKGVYFENINKLDSAEFFYRKALYHGYHYDAYKGLLNIFIKTNISDSIYKYSILKEEAFSNSFSDMHTQAMFNADGMYNYARNQRLAMYQKLLAEQREYNIIIITIISIIVNAGMICLLVNYRNRKKREIQSLECQFDEVSTECDKAKSDYALMTVDFETYKELKAQEIAKKEEELAALSSKMESYYREEIVADICGSNIVKTLRDKENIKNPGYCVKISEEEWNELFSEFRHQMPNFYSMIIGMFYKLTY